MELTVGPDLSPGPDALSPARVASPAGVLDLLETAAGLRAPLPSETERITALLPTLRTTPGYWSRSLTADEWGTARRLLRDLAALTLEGWAGQPISQRWDALWQVTRGTGPTQGERWQAVATALTDRPTTGLRTLNLLDPLPTWPGSIRRAFERLTATGTDLACTAIHERTSRTRSGSSLGTGSVRHTRPPISYRPACCSARSVSAVAPSGRP